MEFSHFEQLQRIYYNSTLFSFVRILEFAGSIKRQSKQKPSLPQEKKTIARNLSCSEVYKNPLGVI